ncbi:ABC transporter substrate-binding protein [Paramicrobacterium agarici]|uniref:Peptide/nickel transport system substrate-binding protein n=1 Tax=Paramicrobacterium agarici TaxID=630514 RepID=A0A2A9E060_9MICO|nr:ABC transporter substrate-binding protein [Microbacterium agarici]PFG31560.1 peptide/nickel transport system substrate-binding protein [Microbacterium agarici]TQO21446.1 peptide/nickel transport system substrate-binding protein [Microbacterium agarici]
MASGKSTGRRALTATAGLAVAALALAGCSGSSGGDGGSGDGGGAIVIGTTDKITTIDPAGSYDNGSFAVMNQIYPFLMNTPYGSPDVEPDIAESAEFTSPNEYTVTLKEGLTFANGNELTSSDVKFSFERTINIADPNGPSSLLNNVDSIEAPDDLTVVFTLKSENDQTFPQVLSSPAGPIVDEDVFSADELTPDKEIVDGKAFAGQYSIESYDFNNLIQYKANPDYKGVLGAPENEVVNVKYYSESSNLKLAVQEGDIDVAYRSLSATDVEDLKGKDNVKVTTGPGGEIRYIVFNFDTMPFGAKTDSADETKALAVRQAMADLIDREQIAEQVYKGTYTPLYSYVPDGLTGANESLKSLYGDGEGGPDADKAKQRLEDAGIETPVKLSIQYSNDHYGPSSADEYALIKSQLEANGLFSVDLQTTEWVQYSEDRTSDVYPLYQLGWFPDYSDAANYLQPFFSKENFLLNHYDNPEIQDLINQQLVEGDADARADLIGQIQDVAAQTLPTLPYLQGAQIAVSGADVEGITLDASFKFRYAPIHK